MRPALKKKLERASVPYAPVQRPDQLLDDPHLLQTGQLLPVPMQDGKIGMLPDPIFIAVPVRCSIDRPPISLPDLGLTSCKRVWARAQTRFFSSTLFRFTVD